MSRLRLNVLASKMIYQSDFEMMIRLVNPRPFPEPYELPHPFPEPYELDHPFPEPYELTGADCEYDGAAKLEIAGADATE